MLLILPTAANVDVTEDLDITALSTDKLREVEADTFWCMSKLLDGIQDNYTFAQPGIQAKINSLKELVQRVNGKKLFRSLPPPPSLPNPAQKSLCTLKSVLKSDVTVN